jgi:putative phage-type endonuclease
MEHSNNKKARIYSKEELLALNVQCFEESESKTRKNNLDETSPALSENQTIYIENSEIHKQYLYSKPSAVTPFPPLPQSDSEDDDEEGMADAEDNDKISMFTSCLKAEAPVAEHLRILPSDFYDKFVKRTNEECKQEESSPQKSEEWLNARKYCITASSFGAAIGKSPYQNQNELIIEKLWNTFTGNSSTEWGNTHEKHAKESFIKWFCTYMEKNFGVEEKSIEFLDKNLIKYFDEPWMGVSPDGIVKYTLNGKTYYELIEYKCPSYLKKTESHPYSKHEWNIPPYYYAQIQGIMGYLNSHYSKNENFHNSYQTIKCWFVVWQPEKTWITLFAYNHSYYLDLHEKLKDFYFKKLLPAFVHRHNRLLAYGDYIPHEPITIKN